MSQSSRKLVLKQVAERVLSLQMEHPIRIGIDGVTASGKSTFAKELSAILKEANRSVIHTTLDGFHNPKIRRYARGRGSAEGYYYDAYNYDGVVENLLRPLGPGGKLKYRTQIFDLHSDHPVNTELVDAENNSILIVDGSFALRHELRDHWDVRIFLSVDFTIAEDRAAQRDAIAFGSADEARRVTKDRYHGAHKIHAVYCRPLEVADLVIQNDDPLNPKILSDRP